MRADYRLIHDPLLRLIRELQKEFAGRIIAVLLPEVVKMSWWQVLLHTHRARKLRSHLLRFGGSRLVIISVPWYLEEPRIEDGMEPPPEERPIDTDEKIEESRPLLQG
ncbi:MAG: hypothetical protein AB7S92_07425 [Parvibaculaceae bacterium]